MSLKVNSAPSACIMTFADRNALGFSKWQTPKPSRSYPSARIYKTYNMFRSVTVIPILKDEGAGTQNNDRLNFMSLSRIELDDCVHRLGLVRISQTALRAT